MSNNYNQTLQSNNIDLQAILDTVNELPNAGGSEPTLQDKTVTPTTSVQKVTADSNYDGLNEVTVNAMPTATQATPTISVNSSGLITASATQSAGYVSAGTKSSTKQLTVQAAQTITPGTSNKTISSGRYLTGTQTIKGDANLKAENIKSGVSIFGITGTHSGGENLEAIISEQEMLILELSAAIDDKAASGGSGGGNIETCDVIVQVTDGLIDTYCYTRLVNGELTVVFEKFNYTSTVTMTNVVVGSFFSCCIFDAFTFDSQISNGTKLRMFTFDTYNAAVIYGRAGTT